MRTALPLGAIALVAVSLWYLTAPPRDSGSYRDRAERAAQTLQAQVGTAALWAEALRKGKTFAAAARVGLADNAERAASAAGRFESYEPPDGSDDIRRRFHAVATRVDDELAELELAARRGEWDEVEAARPRLQQLIEELARLRAGLRR